MSVWLVTWLVAAGAAENAGLPRYVGRAVCHQCHVPGAVSGSCKIPPIATHGRAFDALAVPEAREIAALSGVGEGPRQSLICLGCHATGAEEGPRWMADSFNMADGVQCEACHGAGGLHVQERTYHFLQPPDDMPAMRGNGPWARDCCGGLIRTPDAKSGATDAPRASAPHLAWGVLNPGAPGPRRLNYHGATAAPLTLSRAGGGRVERPLLLRPVDRTICGTCHRELPSHQLVLERGYRRSPVNRLYQTPVNLATSPDGKRLYVTCEHSNSLLVVDPIAAEVLAEIDVGRRPHDVSVSPTGTRIYVTNRVSDSLTVIDAADLTVLAEIPVGDDPHGVLADAAGRYLFVLNTAENSISVIDAPALTEVRRLAAGRGPWSLAPAPQASGTGFPAGGPRTLYVTSVRPDLARFREPHQSEITVVSAARGIVISRPSTVGANMLKGIAVVPAGPHSGVALFTMMRSKNLVPATRLAQGWMITSGLGVVWPDGRVDQVLLDLPHDYFPDPNDVAISPDGRHALVTSGGSDRVAVVNVSELLGTVTDATERERKKVLPNHLGMSSRYVIKHLEVGSNPRGIVFAPNGKFAYVANALDDSVSVIETAGFQVAGVIDLGGPKAVTELRQGEKLFHSANITFCRQFSCQSCHPDGHVHGLTIDIEADGIGLKPVDNRTLRGILDTAPFKWEGTNPTLSQQCGPRLAVFFTRLAPYAPDQLQALVRYMSTIERPPNRHRPADGLTPAQYRGKLVFERTVNNRGDPIPPQDRCSTCHNGPYKTAQTRMATKTAMWFDAPTNIPFDPDDVFNAKEFGDLGSYFFAETKITAIRLDVPHLNNIYDSAPYLHNGSANTLQEIWTRFAMLEGHGLTGDLTRRQFNDLIAYLKGL